MASACNSTKCNTPSWVFSGLYNWTNGHKSCKGSHIAEEKVKDQILTRLIQLKPSSTSTWILLSFKLKHLQSSPRYQCLDDHVLLHQKTL